MAVKPTPNNNLYKGLVFDGVDSRDYGIYITGDAVFNSPERDVEMIEIPGRNGAYALDKGRFGNIEVSYPAGIFGDTEADFREGIRAFRNALASRKGYKRLEDDYNPTEYRMAVYKSGLEVTPTALKAGEFTITFDCQPQRFLKSGETAVSVASGGTITNPTLFEASPLLQVWGYGDIGINDDTITIADEVIGNVVLWTTSPQWDRKGGIVYSQNDLRVDDTITMSSGAMSQIQMTLPQGDIVNNVTTSITSDSYSLIKAVNWTRDANTVTIDAYFFPHTWLSHLTFNRRATIRVTILHTPSGGTQTNSVVTCEIALINSVTATGSYKLRIDGDPTGDYRSVINSYNSYYKVGGLTAYSTKSALGEPLYFDLDIGEAYKIEDGHTISVNNAVSFPAQLPVLKSGSNTITYDDTVDQFRIVPRWWEV